MSSDILVSSINVLFPLRIDYDRHELLKVKLFGYILSRPTLYYIHVVHVIFIEAHTRIFVMYDVTFLVIRVLVLQEYIEVTFMYKPRVVSFSDSNYTIKQVSYCT